MLVRSQLVANSKIYLLGEAPGKEEDLVGIPFIGESGQELSRMLHDAGVIRSDCSLGNVFQSRPENNDLSHFSLTRQQHGVKCKEFPPPAGLSHYPSAGSKLYFDPELYVPEIERIRREIEEVKPNLVVTLGNIALWAMTRETGIKKLRGTTMESRLVPGLKILPTYHPAAVLRDWSLRVIVVADLMRAGYESTFPEIRVPDRELWLAPSVGDILEFERRYFPPRRWLAVDIETSRGQITCIGFSPDPTHAIVIPLVDLSQPSGSFYSFEDERKVYSIVACWLADPALRKVFQNGAYDIQYLTNYGWAVVGWSDDTMLQHHSLYSELPKDLGFLGSIYTLEPAWKMKKPRGGEKFKKEE